MDGAVIEGIIVALIFRAAVIRRREQGEEGIGAAQFPVLGITFVVSQLSLERYQLTVKDFRNALTTRASWLVKFVPQTILTYMERKIESRISDLKAQLAGADSQSQDNILTEILKLQAAQKKVQKEMQ